MWYWFTHEMMKMFLELANIQLVYENGRKYTNQSYLLPSDIIYYNIISTVDRLQKKRSKYTEIKLKLNELCKKIKKIPFEIYLIKKWNQYENVYKVIKHYLKWIKTAVASNKRLLDGKKISFIQYIFLTRIIH